jgi:glucose-1-phosphate adenylyltransferase
LGSLTKKLAKPAVPFGGKYRIIDFALSNCHNSGIDTVGVLTQYQPLALHGYIGQGSAWDLDRKDGGVYVLPPYAREYGAEWYKGTADAIYQNINFIEMMNPNYVLVLSGDHIYSMDYSAMLEHHKRQQADATIAVIEVPWAEASRFGILNTKENRITDFQEKPPEPESNLASMGIYIFNWRVLKRHLEEDAAFNSSSHDFGKNIIPAMLVKGLHLNAYRFKGYWKDVGTIDSLWEANMDLLSENPELNLSDPNWRIYSVNATRPPHYVGAGAKVERSLISEGCIVLGEVEHSVIFPGVYIGEGAKIKDSVIMPYVHVGSGVKIEKTIVGRRSIITDGVQIGNTSGEVSVINGVVPFEGENNKEYTEQVS